MGEVIHIQEFLTYGNVYLPSKQPAEWPVEIRTKTNRGRR